MRLAVKIALICANSALLSVALRDDGWWWLLAIPTWALVGMGVSWLVDDLWPEQR